MIDNNLDELRARTERTLKYSTRPMLVDPERVAYLLEQEGRLRYATDQLNKIMTLGVAGVPAIAARILGVLTSSVPVHDHGPDEGRGLDCPEYTTEDGDLRGACLAPYNLGPRNRTTHTD